MSHLELAPAIAALRARPQDFELRDNALHHLGSRHSFRFRGEDQVWIEAVCGCSVLQATPEQSRILHQEFQQWRESYWRPLEINREFAAHFAPPGLIRRIAIALLRYLIAWRPAPRPLPLGQQVLP